MLLIQSEEALTCATDFKNPKVFSLMQKCTQNLSYSKHAIMTTFTLEFEFWIHICIKVNNLVFLKSLAHVSASPN